MNTLNSPGVVIVDPLMESCEKYGEGLDCIKGYKFTYQLGGYQIFKDYISYLERSNTCLPNTLLLLKTVLNSVLTPKV
jgi:hypothetical protein